MISKSKLLSCKPDDHLLYDQHKLILYETRSTLSPAAIVGHTRSGR
jgi:hypothetical protein